jgi:hypothetical protein
MSIRLTTLEIEALLIASGAADPEATMEGVGDDREIERMDAAWKSGEDKLRAMLAQRTKKVAS